MIKNISFFTFLNSDERLVTQKALYLKDIDRQNLKKTFNKKYFGRDFSEENKTYFEE
jgi:hypothetical protein